MGAPEPNADELLPFDGELLLGAFWLKTSLLRSVAVEVILLDELTPLGLRAASVIKRGDVETLQC